MFCSYCGKKVNDDAVFCDGCGSKLNGGSIEKETIKFVACPICGSNIPFNSLNCPSCGNEISSREVKKSIRDFNEKYLNAEYDSDRIQIIKVFPIPNTRSDIIEFALYANSMFDFKYYYKHRNTETVDGAWFNKIKQCSSKAHSLMMTRADLEMIDNLVFAIEKKIKHEKLSKLIMILTGIVGMLLFTILFYLGYEILNNSYITYPSVFFLCGSIAVFVLGCNRGKVK